MPKKTFPTLPVLAAVCILSLALMAAALVATSRPSQAAFTPPPFDPAARTGTPAVPEGLGWQAIDARVFTASVCGVFRVEDGRADVWLTNPATNTVWLKLRVLDANGRTLGETGLLCPGEYLQAVTLDTTPPSGSAVTLKLMAYEPETYHSAGAVALQTTVQ